MLWFWIILAAIVYFALLACVLVFFASVAKMNRHWDRVFKDCHHAYDGHWRRAA